MPALYSHVEQITHHGYDGLNLSDDEEVQIPSEELLVRLHTLKLLIVLDLNVYERHKYESTDPQGKDCVEWCHG